MLPPWQKTRIEWLVNGQVGTHLISCGISSDVLRMLQWWAQPWWRTCEKCRPSSRMPSIQICVTKLVTSMRDKVSGCFDCTWLFTQCWASIQSDNQWHCSSNFTNGASLERKWYFICREDDRLTPEMNVSTKHKFSYKLSRICILVFLKVVCGIWPDFGFLYSQKLNVVPIKTLLGVYTLVFGFHTRKYRVKCLQINHRRRM